MLPKISVGGSFEIQFPICNSRKIIVAKKGTPPPHEDTCLSGYVISLEPTYQFPLKITAVNNPFSTGSLVIANIKTINH